MAPIRPDWCLDPTCTPQSMSQDRREGGSGFCCGQTAEPMVTERRGIRHENDGHFCIKSPRGIVMLEINNEDLQVIARHALRSMLARDPKAAFPPSWYTGRPFWPVPDPAVFDVERGGDS